MNDFKEQSGLYKREVWETNGGRSFKWGVWYYVVGLAWYKIAGCERPTDYESAMRESKDAYLSAIAQGITDADFDDIGEM